ncbi:hypothetical protein DV515_00001838 [Chloebia gouldiae]|uniref:Uncharacterized protein n=1 Tax=Chloebia gouldiae TaxID=44316 RepID=A0A3L8SYX8_CHLGU|nr:hypothetical protein DV515_00001838 [Chloebia gouldiae]
MFKKLKQKISEEQVLPRGASSVPPQVPSKSPPSTGNRIRTTSFTDQNHEGTVTPDKEDWFYMKLNIL